MMPRRPVLVLLALALPVLGMAVLPPGPARAEDAGGTGPLVVDRLAHDFGQVGQEQEMEASFTYRNAGDGPLTGLQAIGDCGCYGVSMTHEDLEPGQEGTLSVKFRTMMFSGVLNKKLKLITSDPALAPVVIRLHVEVVAGVIVSPGRLWFGDVLVGTSPSKTVYARWHKDVGTPFEVTGMEIPGYDFEIETAPYEQGDWKGTAVTVSFKEAPPLGMFSATALLRTDNPDYPRISLPVTANVTGKVWVQSRTVYFGWVRQGKAKKTSVLIKPFSKDVDLGTVTARSRKGHVEVSIEKHPMGRDGWWRMIVEVPATAEPGKLDDVLEVQTAVPGEEITEIEVRGEVLKIGR